ncbi:hypothetical protein [Microcoleus sp. B4-C1]|uniref:hypothetical protein n=1 Tax=Microcoleus sp. B4-C1 TaxID=2818660 RepID=UPI002FD18A09
MAQYHSTDPTTKDFIHCLTGNRLNAFRSIGGRGIRRAAERKRRIEAKKTAKQKGDRLLDNH